MFCLSPQPMVNTPFYTNFVILSYYNGNGQIETTTNQVIEPLTISTPIPPTPI